MKTILAKLDEVADGRPDKPLFVFPETRWNGEQRLTYGSLASRSKAMASCLASYASFGDRALLLFPIGPEFWEAFMGCLASGVIAVPLKSPNLNRPGDPLKDVCLNCTPTVLITDESTAQRLRTYAALHPELSQLPVLTSCQWRDEQRSFQGQRPTSECVAFLQYTSGSTANPKGVQISHANLLGNLAVIQERMAIRINEDSGVTWLPHYHDMGLVGSYLAVLYTQNTSYCLPPEEFALRPARWLELISEHKASFSGGPDFAYRLCVEKIGDEQLDRLTLSSWQVAYTGAERIRAETIRRFTEKFSSCGFRKTSFFPCYGLGEATLMVSGGPRRESLPMKELSSRSLMSNRIEQAIDDEQCTRLVGCGQAVPGSRVLIVNPEQNQRLPEEAIGEVVVSGPCVTRGYFNGKDINEQLFCSVKVDGIDQPFLRTGDQGFLSNGELYITGRTKEVIIVRGRNISPEDIESRVCDAHDSLSPGGVVAFSVERNDEEVLIVAAELKRTAVKTEVYETVTAAIRTKIANAFGVNPSEILLLLPASIPRTSSGKPRRLAFRDSYNNETCQSVFRESSRIE